MATLLRWLGIIICGALMVGFGICGAWGVLGGVATLNPGVLLIMGLPGVIGLGLAYLCYRVICSLYRKPGSATPDRAD
jgi:hypothetical protein